MEPGAIAELQELIQAQLVAKKAAQPNISNLLALQLRQRHAAQIRQLQRSLSPTSSSHSTGHESQYYGTRHDLQAGLLASKSIKPLSQSMGSLPSASSSSITSTSSSLASSPNPNNRLQPLSAWPKSEQSIKSQSQQNKKVHRTPYNIPDVFPESLASGEVDLTSVSSMNSYNSMSSAAKKKAGHGRMKKLFPPSHVEHVTAHLPDDMSTISRPASAELMQNVTDVFQDLVKRRTQVNQSRNSTSEFTSKLKLPRELGIAAKYEYHKSKQMMNALIDDVQSKFQRSLFLVFFRSLIPFFE